MVMRNRAGSYTHYTPEDRELLKKLFVEHVGVEIIAKRLKRSVGSVRQQINRLGLHRNASITRFLRWTPPHLQLEHVAQMGQEAWIKAAKDWQAEDLAKIKDSLHLPKRLFLMGMAEDILPRTDISRNSKISILRGGGWKLDQLGELFGVSRERIRQISDPNWVNKWQSAYERKRRKKRRSTRERKVNETTKLGPRG